MEELSDESLVDKWLSNHDEKCAGILYRRWTPRVERFALAWCGGKISEAEDLSQEIFISMFQSLRSFKRQSGFGTWLLGLARHKAVDFVRTRVRERARTERHILAEHPFEEIREGDLDPARRVERTDEARRLWESMEKLSETDRSLLVMFEIDGFGLRELSEIFAMKEGTLKSRLARARKSLARDFGDMGREVRNG